MRFWGLLRIWPLTRMIDSESEFLRAEGSDSVRQGVHWPPVGWRASRAKGAALSAPHIFRLSHNFAFFSREWLVTLNCCQLVDCGGRHGFLWPDCEQSRIMPVPRLMPCFFCGRCAHNPYFLKKSQNWWHWGFFIGPSIEICFYNWKHSHNLKSMEIKYISSKRKNNPCQTKQLLSRHK